ncbi:hypothetical protein BDN72DRAFT_848586, partial [Pluteus cervinus]
KASRLQKLQLKFPTLNVMSANFVENWSRLTHIELGYTYSDIFLYIFSKMQALLSCKVSILVGSDSQMQTGISTPTQINLPFLRTFQLVARCDFTRAAQQYNFPSLETLFLSSEGWDTLAQKFLISTTSLREFGIQPPRMPLGNELKTVLGLPALSELTHFTLGIKSPSSKWDIIGQPTLKGIASGRLIPHLHTLHLEGEVCHKMLIHLLVSKGFVSVGGPTIFPDVLESTTKPRREKASTSPAKSHAYSADPFRHVKIVNVGPNAVLRNDVNLRRIVDLVGSGCFVMEVPETERLMELDTRPEIGWEIGEW